MSAGLTRLAALAAVIVLAACAADKPKPTPLTTVAPKMAARVLWSAKVDAVTMPMSMVVRDGAVVVAADDGSVLALDVKSGAQRWRGQVGAKLSAGVGSDGRFAAVVTRDNELVLLELGQRKWSARLDSSTSTAPLVAGERVFVMGVDRVIHAFDALDGRKIWTYQRPGEALTLAQAGVIGSHKDTLVVGQGAALVGLDPTKGTVRWETAITSPRGTNEVERLNDLIGPALRQGDVICARAFQTAVGCVNVSNASLRWSRLVGGQRAVGGDAELVFGADASDRVTAWRASNGDTAWTNESMLYRALSAPVSLGRSVVFGDIEGQLHFLDRQTGEVLLRQPTDGSAIEAMPVGVDVGTIVVVTRGGGIFALRVE